LSIFIKCFIFFKKLFFRHFFSKKNFYGKPICAQPALLTGRGKIIFGEGVRIGFFPSPFFLSGYAHIEARNDTSLITIGDNTFINNNLTIIAERNSISIGKNCLIGLNVEILDSDFHPISVKGRKESLLPKNKDVQIEDWVMLGNNVKILKGVTIGEGSFVGAGSIVTKNIPPRSLVVGNPARVVREILE
jgi:maltose O-acetyltransferase